MCDYGMCMIEKYIAAVSSIELLSASVGFVVRLVGMRFTL